MRTLKGMVIFGPSGVPEEQERLAEPVSDKPSAARSALMARIRPVDTKPEMVVRRLSHGLGYRFRLHQRNLPGTPDLVFPRMRKAIFVHGCFWHRHLGCKKSSMPKTRVAFWTQKFADNIARDARKEEELVSMGWRIMIIWECEIGDIVTLRSKIQAFLSAE